MKKNALSMLFLCLAFFAFSQTEQIEIAWKNPSKNNTTTSVKDCNIQACINSPEEINQASLFLNDVLVKDILLNSEIQFRGTCDFRINETLELKKGENIVKIIAKTDQHIVERKIVINYDYISARYHALIIAVQDYDDDAIPDLNGPVVDANKLKDELVSKYTFEEEDIILLENPTKSKIIGTLHKLRKTINEEDNLLIFYAGHGVWEEDMQTGYWLPSDSEKDNPVNWLENSTLTNYLNAIKSKHTLLIADACFSGGIFKTRKAFSENQVIDKLYQLTSRKAMTSGALNEVPDKSVFIKYLVKRLNDNEEKYITSEQLFTKMRYAVINNSQNVPQYGTIQNTGDEGGDFIFIKRNTNSTNIAAATTVVAVGSVAAAGVLASAAGSAASGVSSMLSPEEQAKLDEQNRIQREKEEALKKAEILAAAEKIRKEMEIQKAYNDSVAAVLEAQRILEEEAEKQRLAEEEQKRLAEIEAKRVYDFDIIKAVDDNALTLRRGEKTQKLKEGKRYFMYARKNTLGKTYASRRRPQYIGKFTVAEVNERNIIGNIKYIYDTLDVDETKVQFFNHKLVQLGFYTSIRLRLMQTSPTLEHRINTENTNKVYLADSYDYIPGFDFINGVMPSPHILIAFGTGYNIFYHKPFADAKIAQVPLYGYLGLTLGKRRIVSLHGTVGKNFVTEGSNELRPDYDVEGELFYGGGVDFRYNIRDIGAITFNIDFTISNYSFTNNNRYMNYYTTEVDSKYTSMIFSLGFEPNWSKNK